MDPDRCGDGSERDRNLPEEVKTLTHNGVQLENDTRNVSILLAKREFE